MEPLVSIVMPVYNVEKYIGKSIDSILKQTYTNFELIIVNDGSPDNSVEIAKQYAIVDQRIKIINKINGGLSDARNAGMKRAEGKYIYFLDSDDFIDNNLLFDTVNSAEQNNANVVIFGYSADFVDSNETVITSKIVTLAAGIYSNDNFSSIKLSNEFLGVIGYAWNKIYRLSYLKSENFTFTKGLSLVEDIVFNSPVLSNCKSLVILDKCYYHYIQRPRLTLGNDFYSNYFELKSIACEARRKLLINWGYKDKEINEVINYLYFSALKSTMKKISRSSKLTYSEKRSELQSVLKNEILQSSLKKIKTIHVKDYLILKLVREKLATFIILIYSVMETKRKQINI